MLMIAFALNIDNEPFYPIHIWKETAKFFQYSWVQVDPTEPQDLFYS